MVLDIRAESPDRLDTYAGVSIAFEVQSVFRVEMLAGGLGGIRIEEHRLAHPYVKDYDAEGTAPTRWPSQFDLATWGIFGAYLDSCQIGGAAIALRAPDVEMLENRQDLALLWDLRVAPTARGKGIGTALFRHAAAWAAMQRCHHLKVETQNVNVPACRFYAQQGCVLGGLHRFAYPALPDEVQLLWYKALS